MIAPATAALRDAAVAVMPADLGALLMAPTGPVALIDACDIAITDPRCAHGFAAWFDALAAADDAACYDVRRSGDLPTWWDVGHDEAADRHAATLAEVSL